ncbi:radical SAM protein [Nocardia terpenica]|uniref:Radical SAM protein n=1 Tax=Nocardia terpenica TaxID=455432 RepID=A0A6G9Z0Y2_9NOCA|nr:radical SAM protein [Nocardia terpenica]QIS19132.1 radical SAM protein [Nocardia terpenica]
MVVQHTESYAELKRRNAELNQHEVRAGLVELSSLPRYIMVELTQGCNLHCPMCRPASIGYREREMDRSIFRQATELLFPAAEMVDIRGWGESLLAPDIDDILDTVQHYGARCRIVTNLSLKRRKAMDRLVEMDAMIDVSLDAATQEVLDLSRTGAKFTIIDENLRRIADRLRARDSIDSLRIVATVQACTVDSLVGLVDYANDAGVRHIVLNEVTLGEDDPNSLTGLDDRVDAAVHAASIRAGELGVELFAGTTLGTCVGLKKNVPFCVHPWSYATIGYDGSVGYCDHLIGPMMKHSGMGDLTKQGFDEIWNGPEWLGLRRWHADGHTTDVPAYHPCFECYRHRNVDFEDVFEPRLERYRLSVTPV